MDFFVHRFPGGTESRPQWKGHSWGHNCWRIGAPESMKTLRDSEKNHYHDDSMNRERCMDNIRTNSKTPGPCFFSMNFNPFVSLSHTQETFRKVFFFNATFVAWSQKHWINSYQSPAFFWISPWHATFGARKVIKEGAIASPMYGLKAVAWKDEGDVFFWGSLGRLGAIDLFIFLREIQVW